MTIPAKARLDRANLKPTSTVLASVLPGVIFAAVALVSIPTDTRAEAAKIAAGWNDGHIAWRSYDDGMAEAARTGKRAMVVVHTTWCPHCARYQKLFRDGEVVALSKRLVMIMIDRDREPALNERLGPGSQTYVPRTLFLKPDGTLDSAAVGEHPRYPHLIDNSNPLELLTVMSKALALP